MSTLRDRVSDMFVPSFVVVNIPKDMVARVIRVVVSLDAFRIDVSHIVLDYPQQL